MCFRTPPTGPVGLSWPDRPRRLLEPTIPTTEQALTAGLSVPETNKVPRPGWLTRRAIQKEDTTMRRSRNAFADAAEKIGHKLIVAGRIMPRCSCGRSVMFAGNSLVAWRAFMRHAIERVRKHEDEARMAERAKFTLERAKFTLKRMASIPLAGAKVSTLASGWGITRECARRWIMRHRHEGIVIDRAVFPAIAIRTKTVDRDSAETP